MKKLNTILFLIFVSLWATAQLSELENFFKSQTQIVTVEKIRGNKFFNSSYKIMVRQPLDHSDTTKGFFLQRVFVAHKGIQNPVLLITEGYAAGYAAYPGYKNELTPVLEANQICVEHRYFGKSWPDSLNWEFLTVANAAADHHVITKLFKEYYRGKWINTGISKGGQTAVYHRVYYPEDVDVTVGYVCPLNFSVEDGRHEPFLKKVPGTKEKRKIIEEFQINVLQNRDSILPKLKAYSEEKGYNYRITMDEVLDYCVLEYPFALWQWGRYINEIPSSDSGMDELFDHLVKVSGPSYFAIEGMEDIKSFFVQAAYELGYYGYDTGTLKKYLSIKTARNYLSKIFLPAEMNVEYKKSTSREVKKFIENTDSEIMFIYGEFDPWSASGFEVPQKNNFVKIVKPGGSHLTRINNLPEDQKPQVKATLEKWLDLEIH